MLKGILSGVFGLMLATIGADTFSATIRFSMGWPQLIEGPPLVAVVIGLFAVAEALRQVSVMVKGPPAKPAAVSATMPTLKELLSTTRATFIGLVSGLVIGIMPGAGQTIAALVAYSEAKRWSKRPELFGKGSLEGVAAPETANNCTQGGDMVPALALGIPGSGSAAIMLTGLILHGVQPGPLLFSTRPDITFNLFAAMIIVNILMLPVGYICIRAMLRAIMVPAPYVVAGVLTLVTVGCFSISSGMFEVGVAFLFGVIGFALDRFGFSAPAVVLGLVLGRLVETSFRRALILSDGDLMTFFERPISAILLTLAFIVIVYPFIKRKSPIKGMEEV
jgi:putative tricarboxylic transport membrane protein